MAQRITEKMLQSRIDHLNRITGSPTVPYVRTENGLVAQVGNYHLDSAYGEVTVCRMSNEHGGVEQLFTGHMPKRELFDKLCAYIDGYDACKRGES